MYTHARARMAMAPIHLSYATKPHQQNGLNQCISLKPSHLNPPLCGGGFVL